MFILCPDPPASVSFLKVACSTPPYKSSPKVACVPPTLHVLPQLACVSPRLHVYLPHCMQIPGCISIGTIQRMCFEDRRLESTCFIIWCGVQITTDKQRSPPCQKCHGFKDEIDLAHKVLDSAWWNQTHIVTGCLLHLLWRSNYAELLRLCQGHKKLNSVW